MTESRRLRGTCFVVNPEPGPTVIAADDPRVVQTHYCAGPEMFKAAARRALPGSELEFGPIGEPWPDQAWGRS